MVERGALQCLHMSYHTLMYTLHEYKPTLRPVASRSLFLDIQIETLLLMDSDSHQWRRYNEISSNLPKIEYICLMRYVLPQLSPVSGKG